MNGVRHILHVHIAAFAIAVARLASPGLRGRPVVVAPLHAGRGLVTSVSREARRNGIFKGIPLRRAREVCPDLTVIEPDPAVAGEVFRAVGRVVSFYTPVWEPAGPGHVYLDVTGTERLWGRARDAAFRISREIESRIGLTATVGVAGNKMVSSIASRIGSREGVMDVSHGGEAVFLAPLRVSALPGIGPARSRLLDAELGITRIGRLAAMDAGSLSCIFGREAHLIRQRAMGIDPTPVIPPETAPAVREAHFFDSDTNDDRLLSQCLYRLVEACSRRMRDRALVPRGASVRIRYSDRVEASRRCRLPRLSYWDFDLYPPLEGLLRKVFVRRVRVRHMEIVFRDFSPESGQLSLFHDAPGNDGKIAAGEALDRIRRRYGNEAIMSGRSIGEEP